MGNLPTIDEALSQEWFAVLLSKDVLEKPVPTEIMGERIVVFRTSQGVHAFKDLCIHRGCALSIGKVEYDLLVCPYHGWKYHPSGQCVDIPAQPKEHSIPLKAKASAYACEEKYGLIWVCLGQPKQGIPEYEHFLQPETLTYITGPYPIQASAPRIIENFLDFSHLMWVHQGILSETDYSEIPSYRVHQIDGHLETDPVIIHEYDPDGSKAIIPVSYVKKALRPLIGYLHKRFPSGKEMSIMMVAVPLDHNRSVVYKLHAQNFNLEMDTSKISAVNDIVMQQDIEILIHQKPEELPLDLQAELSLKSDQMSISYRKWLNELGVKMGTAESEKRTMTISEG